MQRLSVTMQSSPIIHGISSQLGSRLAGSFSSASPSPSIRGQTLQGRQRSVSHQPPISRASIASPSVPQRSRIQSTHVRVHSGSLIGEGKVTESGVTDSEGVLTSKRMSGIEGAALRLQELDQEVSRFKRGSIHLTPLPLSPQPDLPSPVGEEAEDEGPDTERNRGEVITHLTDGTAALTLTAPTDCPADSLPCDPSPVSSSDPLSDPSDPATDEPAPPPPTAFAAFVAGAISSFIFSIVYLPFTVAILTQSAFQSRPILPKDWQTELQGPYWLFSFSLFGFLFVFPFILVFALLSSSGVWSIFSNNVSSAIPFTLFLALYLSLFVLLHFTTFYYAYLRKDLCQIHSRYRQFHLNPSNLLCVAAIIFEAFQLISPWLSIQSLGLHNSNDNGMYKRWLTDSAKVFGIGSWQVVSVNTYLETFWIAFSIVIFYAFALGYGIWSNMQPDHRIAPVLFELIPGTFYLSIVARLFSILNCNENAAGDAYVLSGNTSIECWNNYFHKSMIMAAFMGLLFYSSSAMFVACYRGDASGQSKDVKFKPVYLVLERTLRDLFAMTTSLISDQTLSRSLSYPILIVLVSSTWYMKPCSVASLTRLKVLSQWSAVWLLTLTFLADMFRSTTSWFDENVPELLIYGWIASGGIYLAYEAYCLVGRVRRKNNRRMTIAVGGLEAAGAASLEDDLDEDEAAAINAEREKQLLNETNDAEAIDAPALSSHPTVAILIDPLSPASKKLKPSASGSFHSPLSTSRAADAVRPFNPSATNTPTSIRRMVDIRAQALKHTTTAAHQSASASSTSSPAQSHRDELDKLPVPGVPRTSVST